MATKDRTALKNDFANGKYATGEKFADLIDSMKVVQLPVVDPQALGTSLSFIDSISQDEDGKITATKKTLDLANAHELNPFKGWYKTGDTLPTDGFDGAYLYFKDTSEQTGQTTIYRWNGTAYADTGTVVDTSNVQTFGSGQAVNAVKIKNENGEEVQGTADVLSAAAGGNLNRKLNQVETELPNKAEYVVEQGVNLFDKNSDEYVDGVYIKTNGLFANHAGCRVSPLIEIEPDTVYAFSPFLSGSSNPNMYFRFVASDGQTPMKPLNPENDAEIDYAYTYGRKLFKSPATAKYAQFTYIFNLPEGTPTTDYTETAQLIKSNELPTEYHPYYFREYVPMEHLPEGLGLLPGEIANLSERLNQVETELPNKAEYVVEQGVNLFDKNSDEYVDGVYINAQGLFANHAGCRVSPLIEIEPDTVYAYSPLLSGNSNSNMYFRFVASDGQTPMKPLNPENDAEINYVYTYGRKLFKSPATAKYAQFTYIFNLPEGTPTIDYTETAQLIKSNELPTEYHPYYLREVIPMEHLPEGVTGVDEIEENGQLPVKGGAIYDAIVVADPLYKKVIRYDGDSIAAGGNQTVLYGWSKLIGDRNINTWSSMAVHGGTITSGTYVTRVWTNGSTNLYTKNEIFTKCYTNFECTQGEQTIDSQSFNSYIVVGGVTYTFNTQESVPRHWICEGIDKLVEQNKNADYIVFEGGTNDEVLGSFTDENNLPARFGVFSATDYSGNYDKTTFCGALDYLFYKAATEYPYAKFGFIIAQKMGTGSAARNRRAIFSYVMRSCEKWGIPYINLWDGSFLNPSLLAHFNPSQSTAENIASGSLYTDGQHLTSYGYEAVTSKIEHWMKGL